MKKRNSVDRDNDILQAICRQIQETILIQDLSVLEITAKVHIGITNSRGTRETYPQITQFPQLDPIQPIIKVQISRLDV